MLTPQSEAEFKQLQAEVHVRAMASSLDKAVATPAK
jgi:hypothetical protein